MINFIWRHHSTRHKIRPYVSSFPRSLYQLYLHSLAFIFCLCKKHFTVSRAPRWWLGNIWTLACSQQLHTYMAFPTRKDRLISHPWPAFGSDRENSTHRRHSITSTRPTGRPTVIYSRNHSTTDVTDLISWIYLHCTWSAMLVCFVPTLPVQSARKIRTETVSLGGSYS